MDCLKEVNAQGKSALVVLRILPIVTPVSTTSCAGSGFSNILQRLGGEEMLLFKEKINYKLAGSGAW